ncbi:MAG TPA: peptidoglycan bridge formation glycyltransferase FemA/FemB family protein [Armatimonadetes bacterium]|nr:peptidoglycan bridge formation glycyltransferase FemA/FemB family protein [Armatimonadota bacterium]
MSEEKLVKTSAAGRGSEWVALTQAEREAWDAFAAEHPQGNFMQSWTWGELKARGAWRPVRLALWRGGSIVAGASVLFRPLPGGRQIAYAPRGPLVDWNDAELVAVLFDHLRAECHRRRAILLKIDPAVPADNSAAKVALQRLGAVSVSTGHGFGGLQPQWVMRLDLTPDLETIFARFKPDWRNRIRRAGRKGVTVRVAETLADWHAFYDLLVLTGQRQGFTVRERRYFEELRELFVPSDQARLFLAEWEGKLLGGALCFLFGPQCWYVYGASSREERQRMPNYLLQWTAIRWAKERGCRVYDFRGVAPPQEKDSPLYGLNRFKAGFSPETVQWIGEYDLVLAPVLYRLWAGLLPRVQTWLRSRRGPRG